MEGGGAFSGAPLSRSFLGRLGDLTDIDTRGTNGVD